MAMAMPDGDEGHDANRSADDVQLPLATPFSKPQAGKSKTK
jgi:hypothetical protein